jgi:hypothetical protein
MERQQTLTRPLSRGRDEIGRAENTRFTLEGGVSCCLTFAKCQSRPQTEVTASEV